MNFPLSCLAHRHWTTTTALQAPISLLTATGWRCEVEEAALTSIYLATLASWLADGTAGSARTQRLLRRLLARAERAAMLLGSGSAAAPLR
jgi:ubiquinone biosynthesis protein COQ9